VLGLALVELALVVVVLRRLGLLVLDFWLCFGGREREDLVVLVPPSALCPVRSVGAPVMF